MYCLLFLWDYYRNQKLKMISKYPYALCMLKPEHGNTQPLTANLGLTTLESLGFEVTREKTV